MASPVVATTNTSSVNTAGTSHTVNLPASIAAGDLLLVFFAEMAPTTTPSTVSATGWTEVTGFVTRRTTTQAIWAFYRWADGGEGSTATFTSSVSTKSAHTSYRITGAENPATQAPEAGTGVTGNTVDADPPSVSGTGGSKDYLFVTALALEGEVFTPWTQPANYSNLLQANTGTVGAVTVNGIIGTAQRALTAASDDPGVWDSPADDWCANTLLVHPAPIIVTPAVVPVVATLPTPLISVPIVVTPATVAAIAALPTAQPSIPATVTPAVVPAAAALPIPSILAASTVAPATVDAVAALPTPSILAGAVVTPAVVGVTASLPGPSVLAAATVTPAVIGVVATLPTPTIDVAGGPVTVTPAVIGVTTALPTPAVLVPAVVTPAEIAAIGALPTPATSGAAIVSPAAVAITLAVPTPTISLGGAAGLVTPAVIALLTSLPTPLATVGPLAYRTPVAYTLAPAGFVRIGRDDIPPW